LILNFKISNNKPQLHKCATQRLLNSAPLPAHKKEPITRQPAFYLLRNYQCRQG
jgi:hypothetical protein